MSDCEDAMLLHEPFDFHARSRGDVCFTRYEGSTLTYGEARARSQRMAAALAALGLARGDRLGVLMRNSAEFFVVIYAASRLGVVLVPLNFRLAPPEWAVIVADAGAKAVIADPEFLGQVDTAISAEALPIRISAGPASLGWQGLEDLLHDAPARPPPVDLSPRDILFQMYTSGTTGVPKGALLSQEAVFSNIVQFQFAMPYKLNPGERSLVVLPLFHIAAITTALGAATCGASLVVHRDVDPTAIAKALATEEIVGAALVPAVIQFLLVGVPGLSEMTFPHLKFIGYGASPIAESVLVNAMAVFKCHFVQGYGMTEMAGSCSLLTEADHQRAMAGRPDLLLSAGRAMPGAQVRVVDAQGADAPPGVTGEIVVRTESMMSGYWQMPEATAQALRGEWLYTGDAGYLDEEGYLFIRDRIKDMIVSGGENIYPAEVESVLYEHPQVLEAAVIGVPDDRWGESVMAVLVLSAADGSPVSEADLDVFCRGRLGGYKVPRRYAFIEALPRNAAGKILKRELRSQYWSSQARQVG